MDHTSTRLAVSTLALALALAAGTGPKAFAATYQEHIRPLVQTQCGGCHGPDTPEYPLWKREKERFVPQFVGPRMDTYAHLVSFTAWPDTGALMRRLDDGKASPDGKAGNMYEYLGGSEQERQRNLALFKDWVGGWTLKRWKEITKEELDAIRVPY